MKLNARHLLLCAVMLIPLYRRFRDRRVCTISCMVPADLLLARYLMPSLRHHDALIIVLLSQRSLRQRGLHWTRRPRRRWRTRTTTCWRAQRSASQHGAAVDTLL